MECNPLTRRRNDTPCSRARVLGRGTVDARTLTFAVNGFAVPKQRPAIPIGPLPTGWGHLEHPPGGHGWRRTACLSYRQCFGMRTRVATMPARRLRCWATIKLSERFNHGRRLRPLRWSKYYLRSCDLFDAIAGIELRRQFAPSLFGRCDPDQRLRRLTVSLA